MRKFLSLGLIAVVLILFGSSSHQAELRSLSHRGDENHSRALSASASLPRWTRSFHPTSSNSVDKLTLSARASFASAFVDGLRRPASIPAT